MDKKQTVFLSAILGIGSIMMLSFLIISATKAKPDCVVSDDLTVTGNIAFNGELKPDGFACTNGKILKRTGANNWDCADDATGGGGDITGVIAGTGLSDGGTSGDVTLNADTDYLQRRVSSTCAAGSSIREINSDGTVTCDSGGGVPSGFCVFSDTQSSCPSGWTRKSDFDGRTIKGDSTPGGTGGSDTHTHTVDLPGFYEANNAVGAPIANTRSFSTSSVSSWPPYMEVIICCKN